MDWYSWLSKTAMEPSLVYEYGLAFSRNELEEDDIAHFNHEFLLSMGISVAKHRLEILKLGSKVRGSSMSRIFVAIKQTKRCLAKHIQNLVRSEDSSALVLVPVPRGKSGMLKRSKTSKDRRSLLANGSGSRKVSNFSGPVVYNHQRENVVDSGDWYYSTSGDDDIKWDAMFRNLKPT